MFIRPIERNIGMFCSWLLQSIGTCSYLSRMYLPYDDNALQAFDSPLAPLRVEEISTSQKLFSQSEKVAGGGQVCSFFFQDD